MAVSGRFGPRKARSTDRWIRANEPGEHPPGGDDVHDDPCLIADAGSRVFRLRPAVDIAAAPSAGSPG